MDQEDQTPANPDTQSTTPEDSQATKSSRKKWALAAGGTALFVLAGAILMQVFRSGEGVAAETGRVTVSNTNGAQGPASKPRHLATVGKAVVTYNQVADEAMARYGSEVLDQLINRTIIEQACKERNIVVSEAEVEQEITKISQDFGLDRDGWLQMLQAERNITPIQYKRDIIWPMLALKKLAGSEVDVTDKDIQLAFERDFGEKVKGRMIMMDNQRRIDEVRKKAVSACEAAGDDLSKAAAEFGKLAREHSIEPTSKTLDGVVPPIRRHTGPENENVENAAFNLEEGEISGIVQVPGAGTPRYAIIFCEGRTEPVVRPDQLNLVKDQIVEQLKKEKIQERVAHVFEDLQKTTPVHNFLTNESRGNQASDANGIQPVNGITPLAPPSVTQ